MNEYSQKLSQAKQYAERGDRQQKLGNYQTALKYYQSVRATLKLIAVSVSGQSKIYTTDNTIKDKIEKYDTLIKQMETKIKQKKKIGKPSQKKFKFGFPETPSYIQIKNKPMLNNTYKGEIDTDVGGLIAKDIKVSFDDIVGMKQLKQILYQAVIIPQKRPDLFKGIRSPPRGILLYGPPGNGKTFITQALAKQSGCTFYKLSAGSIMNKLVGESEKMMKKIFDSAKKMAPSIIFIDEIDSILTARSESDNDASRRVKTQFLIQFDGIEKCNVILIGATNLPNSLDLAALRRFNKLVYVGLPDSQSRKGIIEKALIGIKYEMKSSQLNKLVTSLDGYSASEITDIVKEACMIPIREISRNSLEIIDAGKIRAVKYSDFQKVLKGRKPLLSKQDLKKYEGKFK